MALDVDVQIESNLALYLNLHNGTDTGIVLKGWNLRSGDEVMYSVTRDLRLDGGEETSQLIWLDHPYTPLEQKEYEITARYDTGSELKSEARTFTPTFEQLRVKGYSTEVPRPAKEDPLVSLIYQAIGVILLPFYFFYLILEGGKPRKK